MKSIKKIIFLLSAVLVLCTSSACKKYLYLEPINNTYDEVFWVNGSNVQKSLSGAYSLLRNAFRADRSFFIAGDLAGDNFDIGSSLWNHTTFNDEGGMRFSYAPYLEGSLQNWTRFYSIINQCNLIIENTPGIAADKFSGGDAQKNDFIAQARFLRAYVYFYLAKTWGDPVLIKETFPDPGNVPSLARSPESETLDFCLEDLLIALDLFAQQSDPNYASRSAAQTLMAHIYAWRHNYAEAESYCNEVINAGSFNLESIDSYKNIWVGQSAENIFQLFMSFDPVSNEATSAFFNLFLMDPVIRNRALADIYRVPQRIRDLFSPEDGRYKKIIVPVAGNNYILSKYDNVDYYDPNNVNTYVVSNNLVLMRLADVTLLRAEARYKNGDLSGALADLNSIRQRAGLPDYQGAGEAFFNTLVEERRRELYGEGSFAYDAIRMEQLERLFPNSYTADRIAQKGYYWPLDLNTLLQQAPLLTQNEWWRSH